MIQCLYKDPNILPSNWFTPRTDPSVVPLVYECIRCLNSKPLASLETKDYLLVDNVMTLTCGPPLVEDWAGPNESALRWIKMFREVMELSPKADFPLGLWLFTIGGWTGSSLVGNLIAVMPERIRDTALCWFRLRLRHYKPECGLAFDSALYETRQFKDHCCMTCISWKLWGYCLRAIDIMFACRAGNVMPLCGVKPLKRGNGG